MTQSKGSNDVDVYENGDDNDDHYDLNRSIVRLSRSYSHICRQKKLLNTENFSAFRAILNPSST